MNKDILGKILLVAGIIALSTFFIIEAFQVSISFGIFVIGVICFSIAIFFLD